MASTIVDALRTAVTNAGGTPTATTTVGLLRQLIIAWGGAPTQNTIVGLLREAITTLGGTPIKNTSTELMRQLIVELGDVPVSHLVALYIQMAGLAGNASGAATVLQPLTLSSYAIAENAAIGATVGAIQGKTALSTVTVVAGGPFDISGTNLVTASALDYETTPAYSLTLRETLAGAANSPRDTVIVISVTDIADSPILAALTLSNASIPENSLNGSVVGTIQNMTAGSAVALQDDAGGRFAISGNNLVVLDGSLLDFETSTTHNIILRETLTGATNTPKDTLLTVSLTDVIEGGGSSAIATPIIDVASNLPGDYPPHWTVNFVEAGPAGADYGDTIECRYGTSNAAMLAATAVAEVLDEGELINGDALFPEVDTWAAAQTVGTTLYWQVRVVRDPGVTESDWSTPATFAIVDGEANAATFTDKTGQPVSTLVWSDPITIAGLAAGAYSRFTVAAGGYLRVNGGAAIDSTGEAIVQNGDTIAVGRTTSALSGTAATIDVYQRGTLYDTFSVTTVGAAAIDIQSVSFGQSAAGTASYTFTGLALGTDDATRVILVRVGSRRGTGATAVPTGVTVAGVAATKICGATADSASASVAATIWAAAVPSGATGDVVVTHATAISRCSVRLSRMVNGNAVALSSGNPIDTVTGTTLTATPTIPANAILLAAAICHATGGTSSWVGATEDFDSYLTSNLSPFTGAQSSTAGTPTLTVTLPSSSSRSMAWAVFGQAA